MKTVFAPGADTPEEDTAGVEEAVVMGVEEGCNEKGDNKEVCRDGALPAFISATWLPT